MGMRAAQGGRTHFPPSFRRAVARCDDHAERLALERMRPLAAPIAIRRVVGPAQRAAQEHGWRFAQPDAGGRFPRPPTVVRRRADARLRASRAFARSLPDARSPRHRVANNALRAGRWQAARSGASSPVVRGASAGARMGDTLTMMQGEPEGTFTAHKPAVTLAFAGWGGGVPGAVCSLDVALSSAGLVATLVATWVSSRLSLWTH
jgi:hypothetical protein